MDVHAGGDHLRRQPAVGGGAMAAERREVTAVQRRPHRQGVLGRAVVREAVNAGVRLSHDVKLAVPPDDGVEFARRRPPSLEKPGGPGQAHVHDQRLDPLGAPAGFRAAGRRGEEIHASPDHLIIAESPYAQYLGEANMGHGRRHAGVAWFDGAVAGNGSGDVGAVPAVVHPQVRVLDPTAGAKTIVNEVGAADALPVRCDIQMVDVEPGVHNADGRRGAAAGEESRGGVVVP